MSKGQIKIATGIEHFKTTTDHNGYLTFSDEWVSSEPDYCLVQGMT